VGQKGKILVAVNTKGYPGKMNKTVEVWTSDPVNKMITLTIAGEVVAGQESGQGGSECQ
jgi:hypothetical protein